METWIYKIKILYNVENTHIGQIFLAVNWFKFVFCFLNIIFKETFKMNESFSPEKSLWKRIVANDIWKF